MSFFLILNSPSPLDFPSAISLPSELKIKIINREVTDEAYVYTEGMADWTLVKETNILNEIDQQADKSEDVTSESKLKDKILENNKKEDAVTNSVKAKEKRIKKLQTQISNQKTALKKQKKVLKKLDSPKKVDNQVVLDSELDSLPPTVQEQIEKESVVFHPNEGPQTEFLAAPERDVLYGGAAGGGGGSS